MVASMHGHKEIVNILIQQRADLNLRDLVSGTSCPRNVHHLSSLLSLQSSQNKWNAVMKAADKGNTEVVSVLIEHGADVTAFDNVRKPPVCLSFASMTDVHWSS